MVSLVRFFENLTQKFAINYNNLTGKKTSYWEIAPSKINWKDFNDENFKKKKITLENIKLKKLNKAFKDIKKNIEKTVRKINDYFKNLIS
jgi:hypothetical protein